MIGIGFRVVGKKEVYYAIFEKVSDTDFSFKSKYKVVVPLALKMPEQLNFIRNTILDILLQHKIERAAIRISEYNEFAAISTAVDRIYLEGVIQEALASSIVEKHVVGRMATLSKELGISSKEFKEMVASDKASIPINDWKSYSPHERESILACLASLMI